MKITEKLKISKNLKIKEIMKIRKNFVKKLGVNILSQKAKIISKRKS